MMPNDDPFADLQPFTPRGIVVPFRAPVGMDDIPLPPLETLESSARWEPYFEPAEGEDEGPQWPTAFDMFDAAALQPRQWIYGRHYLRRFVSVLASAGGIGKTSLQIVEALSICTGRSLLNEPVHETCPVWLINLEDPLDEMQRRVLAAMQFFGISPDEIRGRFFLDAGRDFRLKFATQTKHGIIPNGALVDHMLERIPERQIGAVFIDPFVAAHEVNENDNMAVNTVVDLVRGVADKTGSAFGLVHHIRKGNGEDASIDSVRGAGSLIGAARAARVINKVSEDEALRLSIPPEDARSIFRVDDGKANLAPPADAATYRRMVGIQIANGEWVGVAVPFALPDAFDGVTVQDLLAVQNAVWRRCEDGNPPRFSDKAQDWVGQLAADVLGLDPDEDRPRIKKLVASWIKSGALRRAEGLDEKRMKRPIVEVGEWATE
jgi:hypothetical protein